MRVVMYECKHVDKFIITFYEMKMYSIQFIDMIHDIPCKFHIL